MSQYEPNIDDVALIFEGGGMRASYTAGVVTTLLERKLSFPKVYGISAGASHTVNYVSRDTERSRACSPIWCATLSSEVSVASYLVEGFSTRITSTRESQRIWRAPTR